MTLLFEMLFNCWCAPPPPDRLPSHLRGHPEKAYAQHAFEEGFKLGMQLAILCLDPGDLAEMRLP